MRLFRMEFTKLFGRKFFFCSFLASIILLIFYFYFLNVSEERSVINGKVYTGYEAIQRDRQITEEFRGTFTDAAANAIIAKYGFPSVVQEYYGSFRDENYLNAFVTQYLGNGYMRDWEDYKISTALYPLEETELGKAAENSGKDLVFDYTKGWSVFLDTFQMGMILGSILILIGISPVFSEEYQTGMRDLLFTSVKGKRGDITAKTMASFILALIIYMTMTVCAVFCTGAVYGFQGGECMCGMLSALNGIYPEWEVTMVSAARFAGVVAVMGGVGILVLCGIVLCVSAHSDTLFHAVCISALLWMAPVLIRMMCGGIGYIFAAMTPLFLVMYGVLQEWYKMLFLPFLVSSLILIFCTADGWKTYQRREPEKFRET